VVVRVVMVISGPQVKRVLALGWKYE